MDSTLIDIFLLKHYEGHMESALEVKGIWSGIEADTLNY